MKHFIKRTQTSLIIRVVDQLKHVISVWLNVVSIRIETTVVEIIRSESTKYITMGVLPKLFATQSAYWKLELSLFLVKKYLYDVYYTTKFKWLENYQVEKRTHVHFTTVHLPIFMCSILQSQMFVLNIKITFTETQT